MKSPLSPYYLSNYKSVIQIGILTLDPRLKDDPLNLAQVSMPNGGHRTTNSLLCMPIHTHTQQSVIQESAIW